MEGEASTKGTIHATKLDFGERQFSMWHQKRCCSYGGGGQEGGEEISKEGSSSQTIWPRETFGGEEKTHLYNTTMVKDQTIVIIREISP